MTNTARTSPYKDRSRKGFNTASIRPSDDTTTDNQRSGGRRPTHPEHQEDTHGDMRNAGRPSRGHAWGHACRRGDPDMNVGGSQTCNREMQARDIEGRHKGGKVCHLGG